MNLSTSVFVYVGSIVLYKRIVNTDTQSIRIYSADGQKIPISVISDALGHDSEKTTLIYLSTLDTSAVDNANSEILAALGEW